MKPMHPLFIYCAGGFGHEVMDVVRRRNLLGPIWTDVFFIDDICGTSQQYGGRVFRFDEARAWMAAHGGEVVIANGEPAVKQAIRERLDAGSMPLGSVIDATSIVACSAQLGPGTIIAPMCVISSNVVFERNVSINAKTIVGHDIQIGEDTVVSSMVNIGGNCEIGKGSYLGMGALIKEGLKIGDRVIIGMGAVVYNDIPDDVIALGNPARPIRRNDRHKVFK